MTDSKEEVFLQFYNYDFDSNEQYVNGLQEVYKQFLFVKSDTDIEIKKDISKGIIDTSKIKDDEKDKLSMQAKVFFFCCETGNILELEDYKEWQKKYVKHQKLHEIEDKDGKDDKSQSQDQSVSSDPPYSSNYEELVDLIMNSKPIPGIKQIPDVVLDPNTASKHALNERKKPWERVKEQEAQEAKRHKQELEKANEAKTDQTEVLKDSEAKSSGEISVSVEDSSATTETKESKEESKEEFKEDS
ncbi:unnamed protein product [[Candida] boidinii]|uniref:Unnamed protein product n=1 Tax=Candida boidinii TaxID=5477 RepID=A0A9W6SXB3_CANBO|nr:hypothetical protein B5S30_g4543 [[Candida] boidinii]OWB86648.1 hypothetical protein B5S33_g5356 [[Candida] boidinii]GME69066.1 unnamed protein product [[Candida] boidinii]